MTRQEQEFFDYLSEPRTRPELIEASPFEGHVSALNYADDVARKFGARLHRGRGVAQGRQMMLYCVRRDLIEKQQRGTRHDSRGLYEALGEGPMTADEIEARFNANGQQRHALVEGAKRHGEILSAAVGAKLLFGRNRRAFEVRKAKMIRARGKAAAAFDFASAWPRTITEIQDHVGYSSPGGVVTSIKRHAGHTGKRLYKARVKLDGVENVTVYCGRREAIESEERGPVVKDVEEVQP